MKRLPLLIVVLLAGGLAGATETVSVPWPEFRQLYRESIEREIMKTVKEPAAKKMPQVYSIEEAVYRLTIGRRNGKGEALLSGRIVSGDAEPIPDSVGEPDVPRPADPTGDNAVNTDMPIGSPKKKKK